ncbi:hypothetical protein AGMMS49940_17470 [Spirochaetia bacterium]|nr:hypothetical protein AGMMS49940_17410 [Spirochaetia bacterium]GHV74445.1 hypothetical protein AGMMS49940_17470 [Spirochaetia bacterium]
MKKKLLVGMLAMVLVLGMVLVGCATTPFDPTDAQSELQGSWMNPYNDVDTTITFSGSNFTYTAKNRDVPLQGTYSISKSLGSLKLTLNGTDGSTWSATYSVTGDKLNIPNEPQRQNWTGAYVWGTFNKQ